MRGEGVAKDELRAVELLRRSAAAGSLDGKINLALAYFHGNGVDKNLNEAARLMREAADVGDKFAQRTLGQFYETGAGVETNLVESGRWYELAAKQGDIDALVFLGDHYRFGRGVEKNAKEAMRYYELAAEKGDASAITCVAEGYLAGEGVEKNESKGMGLLQKAADAGNEKAKVRLELAKKKQALTELLGSIEQLKNRTQAGDKVTRKELVSVVQSKLASVTDPKFRAEMETMVTEALSSAEAQREPNIESLAAKARIPNVQNVELGDLRTTDGHEYQGVRIVRSDQAGITIKHSAGIGTIPWTTLPELVQKKLGYDAAAVATYARIQAQAQAKAAEYARRVRTTDEAIQEWLAFRSNPNKYERSRTKWDVVFEYDVETAGGIMFPGLRRNYCHLAGDARYGVIVGKHLDLDKGVSPTDDPSGPKLTRGNRYRVDAIFTAVDEESGKVFLAFDSIFDLGLDR
jgi:TPR repeat protein